MLNLTFQVQLLSFCILGSRCHFLVSHILMPFHVTYFFDYLELTFSPSSYREFLIILQSSEYVSCSCRIFLILHSKTFSCFFHQLIITEGQLCTLIQGTKDIVNETNSGPISLVGNKKSYANNYKPVECYEDKIWVTMEYN